MKKILITTLIMMGAMVFAQDEITAKPFELRTDVLTEEQWKAILERDQERVKMIQERVKAEKEKAEKEKEVKELKVDTPKAEEVKSSPVISKIYTFTYDPKFMRNNKAEATVEVNDQVEIKLTGDGRIVKWIAGKDENAVMDIIMTYHNENGKRPYVETIDFDIDEDEAEIIEKREDGSEYRRPYVPVVSPFTRPNRRIQTRNRTMGGFPGGFEGPFPNQPGMMGIGQNMMNPPGRDPFGQPQVIPTFAPTNEYYVFVYQAMEAGTEKLTFTSGAGQTFELTVKVKGNPKLGNSELNVEHIISTDRQAMFTKYGEDYKWFKTSILLKEPVNSEKCDGKIEKIINTFQVVKEIENGADVFIVTFTHEGDKHNEEVKHDFIVGLEDLNKEEIKVTFSDALKKLNEANIPKPQSCEVVLFKGNEDAQWVFGDEVYVDAKTGAVTN